MASGLSRAASAYSSAKSLGSFVEVGSAVSSEFEPVDLEEEEMSTESSPNSTTVLGKTLTPPATTSSLRSVPEQARASPSLGGAKQDAQVGDSAYEPIQDGLQNLENATQKAAEMAKDFTNKLFVSGAAEARSSVLRLAGDVSSWWAALDPVPKQPQETPLETSRSLQGSNEVQDLFGLPENEELMERFSCTLVQTVECSHNNFSKPQQVKFSGKLYITEKHSCFNADGIRFAISHGEMRQANDLQGMGKSLRLGFGSAQKHIILEGFQWSEMDRALGLLEHIAESA